MNSYPPAILAAAERLRRINSGETHWQVYDRLPQWSSLEHDRTHLADAFLARLDQEREGMEPVTEEWLRSIGFVDGNMKGDLVKGPVVRGIATHRREVPEVYWCVRSYPLPDPCTTRSDVLALLRALKVRE